MLPPSTLLLFGALDKNSTARKLFIFQTLLLAIISKFGFSLTFQNLTVDLHFKFKIFVVGNILYGASVKTVRGPS